MTVKRILFTLIYLLAPGGLVLIIAQLDSSSSLFWVAVGAVYLLTLCGVVYFFMRRPVHVVAFLSGLALSPVPVFVYERMLNSEYLPNFIAVLSMVYYAFPFLLVSAVILIVIYLRGR